MADANEAVASETANADLAPQQTQKPRKAKTKAQPQPGAVTQATSEPVQGDAANVEAGKNEDSSKSSKKEATAASGNRTRDENVEPWFIRRGKQNIERLGKESMPFLKSKISLNTRQAQEIYDRANEMWTEAMLTLSVTMRNFKPEDQCLTVDGEVDRLMDECFKAIANEKARLRVIAENNGCDVEDTMVEYTHPKKYELKIVSPRETRFHKLLVALDEVCMIMDALWMMQLITDRGRSKSVYDMKSQILRTCGRARNLVFRAQASSQRNGMPNAADPRAGTALDPNKAPDGERVPANDEAPATGAELAAANPTEIAAVQELAVA